MQILTRKEMVTQVPRGTIYFELGKAERDCVPRLMRHEGRGENPPMENDWFESTVGPHWVDAGFTKDHPYYAINTHSGREATYVDSLQYVVLNEVDVTLLIRQLLGLPIGKDGDGLEEADLRAKALPVMALSPGHRESVLKLPAEQPA